MADFIFNNRLDIVLQKKKKKKKTGIVDLS